MEEELPGISLHKPEDELFQFPVFQTLDKAQLVEITEQGMIPREDGIKMLKALREMEKEGLEEVRLKTGGSMHGGEHYLIRKLGEEVGGRIHLARSSTEQTWTSWRMNTREKLLQVMAGVNTLRDVFLKEGAKHVETVMPGYTHNLHAQPITWGDNLTAWASALQRDFERLEGLYYRVDQCPLGAVTGTGTNFPVNRQRLAELTGFQRIGCNTLDFTDPQRDWLVETVCVIAILQNDLLRWMADIRFWSCDENKMLDIPDRYCSTSSIMMQKKNACGLEEIIGAACTTIGGLMTVFMVEKAPSGYPATEFGHNRKVLFSALDYAIRDLDWIAKMIPDLKVNKELMLERAGEFWAQGTDVAGALVKEKGLPWRTAHQIVGILVRLSYERGIKPRDVDTKLLDEASIEYYGKPAGLSEEALKKSLDPVHFVKERTLYGGTAPEEVLRQISEFKKTLEKDKESVSKKNARIEEASDKLEKAIDTLIES